MDKNSLQEFGWLAIIAIILASFIIFASLFASLVTDGVDNTLAALKDITGKAVNGEVNPADGGSGGGGGSSTEKTEEIMAAGLYEAGAIALYQSGNADQATKMLKTPWSDLLASGVVHVEDGVLYTNYNFSTYENDSSDALVGDLVLPSDGSITQLGDAYWDDNAYDEYWGGYGRYAGHFAFNSCYNLTGIYVPSSVSSIGTNAFLNCDALIDVVLANGVSVIGESAFSHCYNIISLSIPSSVTVIEPYAFYYCGYMESVKFETNSQLNLIDEYAFSHCLGLREINLEECKKLTTIGADAFEGCEALESVYIPASVTTIEAEGFCMCMGLKSLTFDPNSQLTTVGDLAFSYLGIESVVIPRSVTTIGKNLFRNCEELKVVIFEDNSKLECLNEYAFRYCYSLTDVDFCENGALSTIGKDAFIDCNSLESIVIPASVTAINERALSCYNLSSVTFAENSQIAYIGQRAFCASALQSIELPASIVTIDQQAFEYCASLKSIVYKGTTDQWTYVTKNGEGDKAWNYAAPATYVQCSDGTVSLK